MNIALESPLQSEVKQLIEDLDAYQIPLYPVESHHGVDISALAQPNILFAVARDDSGRAVGCGAIVLQDGYGELKRFYTSPSQRGKGVAWALLGFLEKEAREKGYREFKLETGYLQPEAIRLYERCGYVRCGPFGTYLDDPNSVFMTKNSHLSTYNG